MWYSTAGCIVMLTLSLLTAPLAARARSPAKMPRIGYMSLSAGPTRVVEVFKQGLRDLGWIEGQTIAIEYRWAAGQVDRLPALAAELVRLQVDLIVAEGGGDRKSTRLNSSHSQISYAVFCLNKKT